MEILKSIKVKQFKFVPAIGFGYWKNTYTGEYGELGYTHCIQMPFVIFRFGIVHIVKQKHTFLEQIRNLINILELGYKNKNKIFDIDIKLSETMIEIFAENVKKELTNAGLIIDASPNLVEGTGQDMKINYKFNSFATMSSRINIEHEPSDRLFSIELIDNNG